MMTDDDIRAIEERAAKVSDAFVCKAARADVPALCAELRETRARVAELEAIAAAERALRVAMARTIAEEEFAPSDAHDRAEAAEEAAAAALRALGVEP